MGIFSSDMASRSPAILLLLALPLLCYVVSIEAHTLPDDGVPDSRGLSDKVVPEFSLEARATKGLKDEVNEFIEARATKGLNDGLLQSRVRRRHCYNCGRRRSYGRRRAPTPPTASPTTVAPTPTESAPWYNCPKDTNGTCSWLFSCFLWRGATCNDNHKCVCNASQCAKGGRCIAKEEYRP